MVKKWVFVLLVILCICSINAEAGVLSGFESFEKVLDKFNFLPEYHFTADCSYFLLHKSDDYRSQFFIETNSDLEFVLVDYKKFIYSVWELYVRTGMGRQPGAIIFDPRDSRYGLIPALELRLRKINLRSGLEHFCFHDIDEEHDPDGSTQYWNKPFIDITSKNYRLMEYRRNLVNESKWDFTSRFAWGSRLGYYWSRMFGLMEESILNGGQNYQYEMTMEARYAFYKRLSWVVNARMLTNWNMNKDKELYQTYIIGFESHFRRGVGGSMFYMDYCLLEDKGMVRDKDRLLQFGIRFYM